MRLHTLLTNRQKIGLMPVGLDEQEGDVEPEASYCDESELER